LQQLVKRDVKRVTVPTGVKLAGKWHWPCGRDAVTSAPLFGNTAPDVTYRKCDPASPILVLIFPALVAEGDTTVMWLCLFTDETSEYGVWANSRGRSVERVEYNSACMCYLL
jgi:hypothetical protein